MQLGEFRNYHTLSWTPSPELNLVTGANAQGKTNLLEAVAVLVGGRSFRTSRLAEIPRWGTERASLGGELRRAGSGRTVRRSVERGPDGRWYSRGEGCEWARVVAFGWRDLEILNGPPAERRNFVDGCAARLYPGHRPAFVRFRQVLARRNHLLQQGLAEPVLSARLAPWDEQLAQVTVELVGRRRRATAALQTELARIFPALAGTGHKAEVRYQSSVEDEGNPAAVLAALARSARDERRRGQTLVGPHRDDLAIEIDGVDARVFGSRGQQRLLALALRLAEVLPIAEIVGTPPVLVLDDALSELDGRVRAQVLREIDAAGQVFLTSPDPLAEADATRWIVKDGGVAAA